jgi:hypothetical protein
MEIAHFGLTEAVFWPFSGVDVLGYFFLNSPICTDVISTNIQ